MLVKKISIITCSLFLLACSNNPPTVYAKVPLVTKKYDSHELVPQEHWEKLDYLNVGDTLFINRSEFRAYVAFYSALGGKCFKFTTDNALSQNKAICKTSSEQWVFIPEISTYISPETL